MTVRRTALGDGLEVGALGYGAMGLSHVYGPADDEASLATLHHAVDSGVTLIDTADVYGDGHNEHLVGRLLADRRTEVTIATKFGITGSIVEGTMSTDNSPRYIRRALEASLGRLGTDTVDLYYLHRRNVAVPIEDAIGEMAALVDEGKVHHLGLSEVTAAELEAAHATHPIAAIESEWSIWSRDVERNVVPTAARLGIGFVPYAPLGRGFLTGGFTHPQEFAGDWRGGLERFGGSAFDKNQAIVRIIAGVADELGATTAQVALAWLFSRQAEWGLPVVPIPGTRRAARIDENLAAIDLRLSPEHLEALGAASELVVGERTDFDDPDWTSDVRERAEGL